MSTHIPRSGAEALMPEEYQKQIIEAVPEMSSVMRYATRAADMTRAQRRIPVLSVLPTAYFTNPGPGDSNDIGYKRTTRLMWENKYLDAEELNVIVAIPESVFDDSDYDIWEQARPKIIEAFGIKFDQAVYYGINAPAIWPTNIVSSAIAAGNFVALNSVGTDLYDDILGVGGLIAKVEEDGFFVNGHVADTSMRARLRALRDSNGQPIFKALYKEGVQGATRYEIDGEECYFPRNGAIVPSRSLIICGDWTQLIYAIRRDITWKVLTESVIQDPDTGEIVYNLAQQNMIALRASMRLAWQVPNPKNRLQEDEDDRYPFSVLGTSGS